MSHLTVVVPIFEEGRNLASVLERLVEAPCPLPREFVFVDDGSSDDSPAILHRFVEEHGEREEGMKVIVRSANAGKGTAVRSGIQASTGDCVVVHDADEEYDPTDIPRLLEPLVDDRADVVYGSRFRREGIQVHRTFHYLVNRLLTGLSNILSGTYLSDMETCYKVFRADLLRSMRLRSERFGFEVEVTAYVAKTRARIFEMPISYQPRTRLAGKKINWRDGVAALWHLVRFNLLVSRPQAFAGLPERYRA